MFLKAGLLSLALLLASRVLGLLRESAQAAAFGASATGDVVVLMLMLPDWLASLVAGGALAYVLLPHWARAQPAELAGSQHSAARALLALGVLLAVAAAWLAGPLAAWLIPGLPAGQRPLAVAGLRHERDFVGMYAANLVVNAVLVASLLALAALPGAIAADGAVVVPAMGLALLAAVLLRLGWLFWRLPALATAGASPRPGRSGPALSLWVWAMLSSGLPLALPFVARSLASASGEGALATFNYAWKLVELPLVLAIQLAASLAFPVITRAFAGEGDPAAAVRRAFALAWLLACAAAAGLLVGAPAAASLLFGWGRMGPEGLGAIAWWGAIGAWGLLPQALMAVAVTVLATQGRLRAVALVHAGGLAALLAGSPWAAGDGARLMLLLNAVQLAMAVALLGLLGRQTRAWLPWRSLGLGLALLLVVATGATALSGWLSGLNMALRLAMAASAAIILIAIVWRTDADARAALRR
jgi:peptidoglycan biosynthesis protein MviN/MurJ (putative lipid II flippase)